MIVARQKPIGRKTHQHTGLLLFVLKGPVCKALTRFAEPVSGPHKHLTQARFFVCDAGHSTLPALLTRARKNLQAVGVDLGQLRGASIDIGICVPTESMSYSLDLTANELASWTANGIDIVLTTYPTSES